MLVSFILIHSLRMKTFFHCVFSSRLCIQGTWRLKTSVGAAKQGKCPGGQTSPLHEGPGHLNPFLSTCCLPSLRERTELVCLNEPRSPETPTSTSDCGKEQTKQKHVFNILNSQVFLLICQTKALLTVTYSQKENAMLSSFSLLQNEIINYF